MYETVHGLVLRENRYKEADRMLTLLTAEHGLMSVRARGSLRKSSRTAAAGQPLCYSEFTLFGNRGRWTAEEATCLEQFLGLRQDVAKLSLGVYFAELLHTVSAEEVSSPETLSLGLNALYAVSNSLWPDEHVKAVFELRLMAAEGFAPEVGACAACGAPAAEGFFYPAEGVLLCAACAANTPGEALRAEGPVLQALRYVLQAPPKKIYAFTPDGEAQSRFFRLCERYAAAQLEKSLPSLDYWKSVK